MNQVYAKLKKVTANDKPLNLTPLKIILKDKDKKQNIAFFQDALAEKYQLMTDDKENWWLTFFIGSPYEQTLFVNFNDDTDSRKDIAKASFYQIDTTENSEYQKAASTNSQYIRKSMAITYENHIHRKSHSLHIDGKGLSFITNIQGQIGNFYRAILLLALAHAYQQVIGTLSKELAQLKNIKHIENINEIYNKIAEFNARYFLLQPVKYDRTDLNAIWEQIVETLVIKETNNELMQQVAYLHHIIELQNTHKAQELSEKQNRLINIFGIILSVIGVILTIIEIL